MRAEGDRDGLIEIDIEKGLLHLAQNKNTRIIKE